MNLMIVHDFTCMHLGVEMGSMLSILIPNAKFYLLNFVKVLEPQEVI